MAHCSEDRELSIAVFPAPVSYNVDNGDEDQFILEVQISAEDETITKGKKATVPMIPVNKSEWISPCSRKDKEG